MMESLIHALVEMEEAEALQRAKQLLDEGTGIHKVGFSS